MAKPAKTVFFCGECGYESARWLGKCPGCGNWNTMVESLPAEKRAAQSLNAHALPLSSIDTSESARFTTGINELDRVLGGGLSAGMVVLLGGDPGIGKSTLLLQAAANIAEVYPTLYVSGEESQAQIKTRAERLQIKTDLLLMNETNVHAIESEITRWKPRCVIVDSIQTMQCSDLPGAAGSISQVRECTATLTNIAKHTGTAIFLVGHVTKDGAIAGPRILEHMVDTVLYFEGERHADLRLLRAVKNRFGSTNEIGVFEMRDSGMQEVLDSSRQFLSGAHLPGCAITCALEGTRPLLAEVQALLSPTAYGAPRRMATGIDPGRLNLLLAVLDNKARLRVANQDVYVNVVGGLRLQERAVDLSIALCIASCAKGIALPEHTAVLGEVGLTGEVRAISQLDKRIRECMRLGFTGFILPRTDVTVPDGASCTKVRNIAEAVAVL